MAAVVAEDVIDALNDLVAAKKLLEDVWYIIGGAYRFRDICSDSGNGPYALEIARRAEAYFNFDDSE